MKLNSPKRFNIRTSPSHIHLSQNQRKRWNFESCMFNINCLPSVTIECYDNIIDYIPHEIAFIPIITYFIPISLYITLHFVLFIHHPPLLSGKHQCVLCIYKTASVVYLFVLWGIFDHV